MIHIIDSIIDPRVKIQINRTANDCELILKEESDDSDVKELTIINIPENSLAFTLDYNATGSKPANSRLFKKLSCYVSSRNSDGVNKSCDLVILTKVKDEIRVIVLDLKSKKTVGSRPIVQIENSILFLDYIFSMARLHYKDDADVNLTIKYVKALITTGMVQKSTVSKRPANAANVRDVKKVPVKAINRKARVRYSTIAA